MQYAMELLARARQADLLRDAESQRLSRGLGGNGRRLVHPQPRLPAPRRQSPR